MHIVIKFASPSRYLVLALLAAISIKDATCQGTEDLADLVKPVDEIVESDTDALHILEDALKALANVAVEERKEPEIDVAVEAGQVEEAVQPIVIQEDEDLTQDRDFLQQVLENLPGVDPNSEAIQSAMSSLTKDSSKKGDGKEGDKK